MNGQMRRYKESLTKMPEPILLSQSPKIKQYLLQDCLREVVYSSDIKRVCNSKKVTDHHAMRCAYGWADKSGVQFKFIVEFPKKKFTGRKKE